MSDEKFQADIIIVTGKSGAGKQPRIDVLVKLFNLTQLSTGNIFREYLGLVKKRGISLNPRTIWDEESKDFLPDNEIAQQLGDVPNDEVQKLILGVKAKFFIEGGKFVPDSITNALFENYFKKYDYGGVVLDGYPRTVNQAEFLLSLVKKHGSKIDFILLVENYDRSIIERVSGRRICPKCGAVFHIVYKPPVSGKFCTECNAEVIQRSDDNEENIKNRLREFEEKALPALVFMKDKGIPVVSVSGNLPEFTEEAVEKSVREAVAPLFSRS